MGDTAKSFTPARRAPRVTNTTDKQQPTGENNTDNVVIPPANNTEPLPPQQPEQSTAKNFTPARRPARSTTPSGSTTTPSTEQQQEERDRQQQRDQEERERKQREQQQQREKQQREQQQREEREQEERERQQRDQEALEKEREQKRQQQREREQQEERDREEREQQREPVRVKREPVNSDDVTLTVQDTHEARLTQIEDIFTRSNNIRLYAERLSEFLGTLEEELKKNKASAEQSRETASRLRDELEETNGLLTEQELRARKANTDLKKTQLEMQEMGNTYKTQISSAKDRIKLLETQLREAETVRNDNEMLIESMQTDIANLRKASNECGAEKTANEQLRTTNKRLNDENKRLLQRIKAISPDRMEMDGFYFSEPLTLDSMATHQQLTAALRKKSSKGRHEMEVQMNGTMVRIPRVGATRNQDMMTYAVRFDKNTPRHYGDESERTAIDVPALRRDTLDTQGSMRVLLRDQMGEIVEDATFDYKVRTEDGQLGHYIKAKNVRVYFNDAGEGTLRLKTIAVDVPM